MAIEQNLEETYRNVASAAVTAFGFGVLLFGVAGLGGTGFEFAGADMSGGTLAVFVLALAAGALAATSGLFLVQAGASLRGRVVEPPLLRALSAMALLFVVLGLAFGVAGFTESFLPGNLPLATLLVIAGLLTLIGTLSYRSHRPSVAATGAVFGIAAAAVLVAVQVVGTPVSAPTEQLAGLVQPAVPGTLPTVGLIVFAVGALLYAYLWNTDYDAVAYATVALSLFLVGLGLLIEGIGRLTGIPWDTFGSMDVQAAVLAAVVSAGIVLETVAGFLFLAAGGLGITTHSKSLFEHVSGIWPEPPAEGRFARGRGGQPADRDGTQPSSTDGRARSACVDCDGPLPPDASFCPSCGAEVEESEVPA